MKPKEVQYILNTIDNEGFAYTFFHYSDFEEIEDTKFHEFKDKFINAAEELAEYLGVDI